MKKALIEIGFFLGSILLFSGIGIYADSFYKAEHPYGLLAGVALGVVFGAACAERLNKVKD